jgi:hypothetical protein
MSGGFNVPRARPAIFAVWTSRVILVAYGVLMLGGYWSQLTDIGTTIRLVGSDVGCSLSAIDCNWLNFTVEKVVGVTVIGAAVAAQIATKWQHRNWVQVSAAIAAIAHLIALQLLLNPS